MKASVRFFFFPQASNFSFRRPPEFKSFEELELPKHSKVKRQTSTPNATELEQQPDIHHSDWKNKPIHEILQKLNVRF